MIGMSRMSESSFCQDCEIDGYLKNNETAGNDTDVED